MTSITNANNPTDCTSIAISNPGARTTPSNNLSIDERETNHLHLYSRSGEGKRVERTTRKECYRLGRRKLLFEKRRQASDYALLFAMIGLGLMVLEQELTMAKIYEKVKAREE